MPRPFGARNDKGGAMHKITTLKNGLTLITVSMPHLDSVTSLVAVGAGSRYESKKINGISHFLEHMFFKGSKKFPSAEQISTLVDGIGAINNAATDKEVTYYWIKSSSKHIELSADLLASMVKESLLSKEEIDREKGVIVEELRMYRDNPSQYVWNLYEQFQYGDQPLGWDIGGEEKIITSLQREDFIKYMDSLYSTENMAVIFAGKLPANIDELANKYFADLARKPIIKYQPFKKTQQKKLRVNVFYKDTDQANLVLGVEAFGRDDKRRYTARVLSAILGEGMSSRLFIQVRERRGLAYHVSSHFNPYADTGFFAVSAGLKLEKVGEGLEVIKAELDLIAAEKVADNELKKAKEIIRGRLAIRSESTNFLAEYFATVFVLDRRIETFEEYLQKIDAVTAGDIKDLAQELFEEGKFNLQIIAPFKDTEKFEKVLGK